MTDGYVAARTYDDWETSGAETAQSNHYGTLRKTRNHSTESNKTR